MTDDLLTREQYEAALERHFHAAKEEIIARMRSLPRRIASSMALKRWDVSAPKYGPCRLRSRSWPQQIQEELIDAIAYQVFLKVLKEREK